MTKLEKESKSFNSPSRKLYNYKDQVISKTVNEIHGRKRMNELPPLVKEPAPKSKVVLFYKNGDRNFRGHHVTVTPRRFRSFDNLLSELTRITNLPQGVRFIFTPATGNRVESLEDLEDGHSYVCGEYPRLKKINYAHAPDGSNRKRKSQKNFIPANSENNKMKLGSNEKLSAIIKPRVITIVRNSVTRPKKTVKVLLNKRTAQTYDQVLNVITIAFGTDAGCVRKLYNISGKLLLSLVELFGEDEIFIAVGNERFRSADIPYILDCLGVGNDGSSSINNSPSRTNKNTSQKLTKFRTSPKPDDSPNLSSFKKLPSIKSNPRKSTTPTMSPDIVVSNGNHIDGSPVHVDIEEQPREATPNDLEPKVHDIPLNKKIPLPSITPSRTSVTSDEDTSIAESKTISIGTSNSDENKEDEKAEAEELRKSIHKLDEVNADDTDIVHVNLDREEVNDIDSSPSEKATTSQENDNEVPTTTSISPNTTNSNDKQQITDNASSITSKNSEETIKETVVVNGVHETHENENIPASVSESEESSQSSTYVSSTVDSKNEENKELTIQETTEKRYVDHQLSSREEIYEFFELRDTLGDGNFAVVKLALEKATNKMYALKIIDVSKIGGKEDMLKNEILTQRESCHPNLVQLIHDFHSPSEIFLAMELISGGDLFDLIAEELTLEEEEAARYTRDLCSGLDYLHKRNIVHRDIKPENLMVSLATDGRTSIKIADFGLAQQVTEPLLMICGTPTYVAPEILKEEGYGLEVDVWAAGVIVYIMLCGFPPFRSPNRKQSELFDLIEAGEYEYLEPYWDDVSESAKDLISKIIVVDIKKRYTCKDVLKHNWLTQYGLTRNNTNDVNPSTHSRFKIIARGAQSIARMKRASGKELERGENFIENVSSQTT